MTRILFWNIRGRPLEAIIAQAAIEQNADIVIICEHGSRIAHIEAALNKADPNKRAAYVKPVLKRHASLALFSRMTAGKLATVTEHSHCLVHALQRSNGEELLIASVHLSSPMHQSERDLMILAQDSADLIRDQESQRRHRQTLVVGDFNMDPYHPGMIASHCFHAVMDRRLAMEESRVIQKQEHYFFYNPMWSRLVDDSPGPPGSYFYRKASPECHFWHAWDQVLVRPAILGHFNNARLSVITQIGATQLLDQKGRPNLKKYSDHLPIAFEI